jgi:hypothetical protein
MMTLPEALVVTLAALSFLSAVADLTVLTRVVELFW